MPLNEMAIGLEGGDTLVIQNPRRRLTGQEAVEMAAWLVALSAALPGGGKDAFETALAAVLRS